MARLRADFLQGSLTTAGSGPGGSYAVADTVLSSTQFVSLPVIASPNTMTLVLDPLNNYGHQEKVTVISHTADSTSVTVSRGTDGTQTGLTTYVHNTGGVFELWVMAATSQDWSEVETEVAANTTGLSSLTTTVTNNYNSVVGGTGVALAGNPSGRVYASSGLTFGAANGSSTVAAASTLTSQGLEGGMQALSAAVGFVVPVLGTYAVGMQIIGQSPSAGSTLQLGIGTAGSAIWGGGIGSNAYATAGGVDYALVAHDLVRLPVGGQVYISVTSTTTNTSNWEPVGTGNANYVTIALVAT